MYPGVRWAENIACMCKTKALNIFSVKPEGSGILRRPWIRLEDNIKMDQMAMGLYGIVCWSSDVRKQMRLSAEIDSGSAYREIDHIFESESPLPSSQKPSVGPCLNNTNRLSVPV